MGNRREVWGDDPVERDADEVVGELADEPEASRKWHDHPAVLPFKVTVRFIGKNGKRIGVAIAGFLVIAIGLVLIPLPGPGWLLVFAGLAILATEYLWARRLLDAAKEKVGKAKDMALRKKNPKEEGPAN